MNPTKSTDAGRLERSLHWLLLLTLCSAYLLGGFSKLLDFRAAVTEMRQFGLPYPGALAAATIFTELTASAMILSGRWARAGAVWLALYTVAATLTANRFWQLEMPERWGSRNTFFEHLGLSAALLLVVRR